MSRSWSGTNSGRVSTHTTHGSVAAGAAWGGLTGLLVGLLFPPLGFLAIWAGGMAVGAGIEKATKENGLPKDFLDQVKAELTKGSSALILFGATGDTEEMAKAFDKYEPTSIVRESISDETVESLKKTARRGTRRRLLGNRCTREHGTSGPVVSSKGPTGLRRVAALGALIGYVGALVAVGVVLFRNFPALLGAWVAVVNRRGRPRGTDHQAGRGSTHPRRSSAGRGGRGCCDPPRAGSHDHRSARRGPRSRWRRRAWRPTRWERTGPLLVAAPHPPGVMMPAPTRPVLLMNPKSGGARERSSTSPTRRRRGVSRAVILRHGDDFQALARDAVARGRRRARVPPVATGPRR